MNAREQWAALMGGGGAQDREPGEPVAADLPAPRGVTVTKGRGQVTVDWRPVPGAIGYAVHRADNPAGPFTVVDHGGGDVLAVPHGPYADTTGGRGGWYAVAALQTVNAIGPLSEAVPVSPWTPDAAVTATVGGDEQPLHRVWQAMVGSEHLSHLLSTDTTGGRPIGAELYAALRRAHDELGVRQVRAHHILGSDLDDIGRIYDLILHLGMRPVVELGFMPPALAADPSRTVFAYEACISPPKDLDAWSAMIQDLVRELIRRYGAAEVRTWAFEVWNEPNLSVFFSGTPADYWRLYEATATAIKSVDPALRVGGPSTAAVGWIDDQLKVDAPVDFLSTHVYGTLPLDLRPLAGGRPLWWTEWGVTATHGSPVNDTVFAAAFLLKGMHSAAGRLDALAPWVVSDHFEELGRPDRLWHGGFGLLTVGNLAKPKFWALHLANRLGDVQVPVTLTGDGAGSLVEAWASRTPSGWAILLWNATLDHGKAAGDPALARRVRLRVPLKTPGTVRVWRVDDDHGNPARDAPAGDWPTPAEWEVLQALDHLDESQPPHTLEPGEELILDLPNPGIAFVTIG
ncbi:xylan 1,4-beta-xylosidase [Actinoplanes sp. NPDC051861]|uniref:GH39 family glycosyl hydrolase n=1 Tax=Actinoplanes sp. NPDC051861 TaxID=3155170 RepID=UPI0034333D0D